MKLNIYHTNDIHSNYNFLQNVHRYMHANKTENDFYFDIGDYNDIKSIVVESDKGESAMDLFMDCKLDLMAIGNNEIDLGYKNIVNLVNKFPIISSNLTDADDEEIPYLSKSVILEKAGKRFLIMSVAPYFGYKFSPGKYNKFFTLGNLKTQDPIIAIENELEKHKGKYDFSILLSHSGHIVDEKLMEIFQEIDLFLGAHTHIITIGEKYSMCGKGELLGKVELYFDDNQIEIREISHINLSDEVNPEFEMIYAEKLARAGEILSVEIEALEDLDFNPYKENRLINFICDALYTSLDCDFAIMHNGISEGSLIKPVSKKTLLENMPSKLNPTVFPVLGIDIVEAVKQSFDENIISQDGFGAGFRGTKLGTLGFSYNVQLSEKPFYFRINGEDIILDKVYKVAGDDYLQRGTGYASLRTPDEVSAFENMYIRDLVKKNLMNSEIFETSKIIRKRI
ncbi:bifunctional metallophosphatase/5'-nucleotidase [Helcococcus kunzii]|uniref:bifunctional metallophosphatase/5'-nucleotidase n=1 Tax=Helcococcus kunzii TaxID=40091 RepID=UPI0024ADFEAD|nr:5'-nucleotidase C-terminal domain-containing protein [Helcococcus kunzii]